MPVLTPTAPDSGAPVYISPARPLGNETPLVPMAAGSSAAHAELLPLDLYEIAGTRSVRKALQADIGPASKKAKRPYTQMEGRYADTLRRVHIGGQHDQSTEADYLEVRMVEISGDTFGRGLFLKRDAQAMERGDVIAIYAGECVKGNAIGRARVEECKILAGRDHVQDYVQYFYSPLEFCSKTNSWITLPGDRKQEYIILAHVDDGSFARMANATIKSHLLDCSNVWEVVSHPTPTDDATPQFLLVANRHIKPGSQIIRAPYGRDYRFMRTCPNHNCPYAANQRIRTPVREPGPPLGMGSF